jgi:hypothetical protein
VSVFLPFETWDGWLEPAVSVRSSLSTYIAAWHSQAVCGLLGGSNAVDFGALLWPWRSTYRNKTLITPELTGFDITCMQSSVGNVRTHILLACKYYLPDHIPVISSSAGLIFSYALTILKPYFAWLRHTKSYGCFIIAHFLCLFDLSSSLEFMPPLSKALLKLL